MNRAAELACRVVMGNVADRMAEVSMSTSELARATDVPRSTLRGWLGGGNFPMDGLWRIARTLTVDPEALVAGI